MKALIDTHVWLWALTDRSRLRPQVLEVLSDAANEVLFSAASAWEIAIKATKGKLSLPSPPEVFVPEAMAASPSVPLPITHRHVLGVAQLPLHHRDPFDRLLIAQAQIEDVPLVSADRQFDRYDIEVIYAA